MTECEKMRREEFYDFTSEECLASYYRAKHICAKLQTMTTEDKDYRKTKQGNIQHFIGRSYLRMVTRWTCHTMKKTVMEIAGC